MKTDVTKKVPIKISSQEQQENTKNSRKTLRVLQNVASDKENLAGRSLAIKDSKLAGGNKDNVEQKQKKLAHKSVQTGEAVVTAADLTADDEPSADYWKVLAEKRGNDLNDSLQENERLKDQVKALEDENQICKEMIEESKTLIEVLQEMVSESDQSRENVEKDSEKTE